MRHLPVLLVITLRPEFSPPWAGLDHVATMPLNRLTRHQALRMIDGVTSGKKLPAGWATARLKAAETPNAQVLVMIVPPVRKLAVAAQ